MLYLDNAATTPVEDVVAETVNNRMAAFGNPSSLHAVGDNANEILRNSREVVADYIGCSPDEIVFTSSGSESNNLALKGFFFANIKNCMIITSEIEHKSVLNSCKFIESLGGNVKYLGVDSFGRVDLKRLKMLCEIAELSECKLLVSIQMANNEIGTIQEIKKIADLVHQYGGVLHTDAVQAFPEMYCNVDNLGIDLMSVSGHKFGCPKGIGFLYKRINVDICPLIHGGMQEHGLRAGTENIPYIAGLSTAIQILKDKIDKIQDLKLKRNYLINLLCKIDKTQINGDTVNRLSNNISISFKDIEGEALLLLLDSDNVYVSAGSACMAGSKEQSHVLKSINVDEDFVGGTIRISLDNSLSYDDLDLIYELINKWVGSLRNILPKN